MKDLIGEVTEYLGLDQRAALQEVAATYAQLVTPQVLQCTRILSFHRGGVLEIEVQSAPLLMELKQYQQKALLKQLQKVHPNVRELHFRTARS